MGGKRKLDQILFTDDSSIINSRARKSPRNDANVCPGVYESDGSIVAFYRAGHWNEYKTQEGIERQKDALELSLDISQSYNSGRPPLLEECKVKLDSLIRAAGDTSPIRNHVCGPCNLTYSDGYKRKNAYKLKYSAWDQVFILIEDHIPFLTLKKVQFERAYRFMKEYMKGDMTSAQIELFCDEMSKKMVIKVLLVIKHKLLISMY